MTKVLFRISGTSRAFNKEEVIFPFLEAVRRRLIADQKAKGMYSSGKTAESLEIEEIQRGGQLVGDDSFQQQISGRRPGKFMPPPAALDYVKKKGIVPRPDRHGRIPTLESLAYMINRKLALHGSDIFQKKRPGLDLEGIVNSIRPPLKDALIKAGVIEIKTGIDKALGKKPGQNLKTNLK